MSKLSFEHDVELEYSDQSIPEHHLVVAMILRAYLDINDILRKIERAKKRLEARKANKLEIYGDKTIKTPSREYKELVDWWNNDTGDYWTICYLFDHLPIKNARGLLKEIRKNIESGKALEVIEFRKLARQINMKDYPHKKRIWIK